MKGKRRGVRNCPAPLPLRLLTFGSVTLKFLAEVGKSKLIKSRILLKERHFATRDTNRVVRPFEWGTAFVAPQANGDDPRRVLSAYADEALARSDEFYAPPPVTDFRLDGQQLTWTSAIR